MESQQTLENCHFHQLSFECSKISSLPSARLAKDLKSSIPCFTPFCLSRNSRGITNSPAICRRRSLSSFLIVESIGLITELGAETDPALMFSLLSILLGEPTTVSRGRAFDSILEEDEEVPNLKPPDRRRPCFFESEPRRFNVEEVDAVNPLACAIRGDEGVKSLFASLQTSPSQPIRLLVRAAGNAETGRGLLFRRGVAPSFSVSVSESPIRGIGNELE